MPVTETYNASGNREDLTDILTRVAPEDTPILAMAKKRKSSATLTRWQVDTLDDPSTEGIPEGSDVSSYEDAAEDRAELSNRQQTTRRSWRVSRDQEASDPAGVPSEVKNAIAKKLIEVKRDIECTIASGNDLSAGSSGVARQCRGLFKWIDTSPGSDVPALYRTPAASIVSQNGDPTEEQFNNMCQEVYDQGGRFDKFICGSALRRVISGYEGHAKTQLTAGLSEKKLTNTISIYETDFGPVAIINSHFLNTTTTPGSVSLANAGKNDGLLFPMNSIAISWLRPLANEPLPDLGGGKRGMVEGSYTLMITNPLTFGKTENTAS